MTTNLEQRVADLEKLLQHTHDGVNSHVVDYTNLFNIGGGNFYAGSDERSVGSGTGTQAITGVGFEPKGIVIFASKDNDTSIGWSVGMSSGTAGANNSYLKRATVGGNPIMTAAGTYCVVVQDDDGSWSTGDIHSFDADGFTISWNNLDHTVNFSYICFG